MTSEQKNTRTLRILVMVAVVVLASGSLTLALGGEEPAEESSGQSQRERNRGSCCCCDQATADANEAGASCQGRNSRRGAHGDRRRQGDGSMRQGVGAGSGRSEGRRGNNQDVMEATRALVHEYRQDIVREVEEIPNGVVTVTRSPENLEAVQVLQRHVGEMKGLLESGGRIRAWDPLFSEIFKYYEEVDMVVETLEDGVRVVETSENPEVVKLIRAHAWKVSDFLARGPEAVHETTPLPDDYVAVDSRSEMEQRR